MQEISFSSRPSPEARRLREAIQAIVHRFSLALRADVECCGMTVAQAATLETLSRGELRLGDLSRRLGISPSTLSRNLVRLEERDLVKRTPDPDDGRAQVAGLTDQGKCAAGEVQLQEELFAESILNRFAEPERTSVVRTLEHLVIAVRNATDECCPGAFEHLMCTSSAPEDS